MKITNIALATVILATGHALGNEPNLKKAGGNVVAAALTPRGGEIGHNTRGTLASTPRPHRQLQSLIDLSPLPVSAFSASSAEVHSNMNNLAEFAFDGLTGTRWGTAQGDVDGWIQVDLQGIHDITKVEIEWETAYASSYDLQVSYDGINWRLAHNESTDSGLSIPQGNTHLITSTFNANCRYVRMQGKVYGSTFPFYSIYEMRLYGSDGTREPTTSPTNAPTNSPTRTPWKIVLPNTNSTAGEFVVDFSEDSGADLTGVAADGAEGVITTKYTATASGNSFKFKTFMVKNACDATTSGSLEQIPAAVANNCEDSAAPLATECTYKFNKTGFANNFNLDTTGAQPLLTLCEVAELSLPADEGNDLIIEQYFTDVFVRFNTTDSFEVEGIEMKKATISASDQSTSLADYISASYCGTGDLLPNVPLCVSVSSQSPDILIETIDEMDIKGVNPQGDVSTLAVIDAKDVSFPAITDASYADPPQSVTVNTMVPNNMFDFEATDAKITVEGSVTVKFAGRRLSVAMDRLLQESEGEERAAFDVTVKLAAEPQIALEDGEAMISSATTKGKTFAIIGMVFASAFALW